MMQTTGNLFTRPDTFFGVCEGLGEDIRIPSNLFRLAFALGLFFSIQGAVIAYFSAGLLVLASRLLFPAAPRRSKVRAAVVKVEAPAAPAAANSQEPVELAKAA